MKESAEKAGLEVIKIVNESTAAGIAYGCIHKTNKEKIVLIFDLGGGYFNFSILKIKNNEFNVLCSEGKENIGGEDFNLKLMDFILSQIKQQFNDLKLEYEENSSNNTLSTLLSIKKECEKIKNQLSRSKKAKFEINLNGIHSFSNLCNELWKDCFKLIENTLIKNNLKKEKIDEIILVGSSSRTPKIQEELKNFFGDKIPILQNINLDEIVAQGAAYCGNHNITIINNINITH